MRCFPFYNPNKPPPIGRIPFNAFIPPSSLVYDANTYKTQVISSVNANTYTQNQLYSYAVLTETPYACLVLNTKK